MADPEVARAALARAEQQKNLLLVYQPIHDAKTGEMIAAEALLRQRRRSGDLREASVIAQAAETRAELFALDSWAMRTAFRNAAQWPIRISVNLSPRELETGDIAARLSRLAQEAGIDTRKIDLEITETSSIDKPDAMANAIAGLKELGVELWLDDFGTGHSSLEHLLRFPVDGLKLPGSFVRNLANDPRSRSVTRALIELAHELRMNVIAEEVETRDQLDLLAGWGCDFIQGFLFSKPMTSEEMEKRFG